MWAEPKLDTVIVLGDIARAVCRNCGRPIVREMGSAWYHDETEKTICVDGWRKVVEIGHMKHRRFHHRHVARHG